MEFGIYLRPASTFDGMKNLALYAEKANYYGIFLNDHVHGFKSKGREPYLEAWTVMTALAMITTKIRLGHVVLFNSLRNPAYLAKSIASLDILSNGRYQILLGAGWNVTEYEGYDLMEMGRGMPSAKERVDRLKESVQILRSMLDNEETNFVGQYWKLNKAYNIPLPMQKNMKITIGCSKDRMIRITAKYADGINVGAGMQKPRKVIDKLIPELKKHNKLISDFLISGFGSITIAKNKEEYNFLIQDFVKRTNKSIDEIEKDILIGTPDILIDKLKALEKLGLSLYIMSIQPASSVNEMIEKYEFFNQTVKRYLQ